MSMTAERLREVLAYDPETGDFHWRASKGTAKAGSKAGTYDTHGYVQIKIDSKIHLAHRLAWLYVHGEWPDTQVDHRNRTRSDNRFDNLRKATNAQNQQNRGVDKNNTSGHPGVHWDIRQRKWMAKIQIDGRRLSLGGFDSFENAVAARSKAKAEHHTFHPIDQGVAL